MVRAAVCSAGLLAGTDSATACIQAGSLLADSKHPQADLAYFHKREFCFTLDGDIFVRYQSFKAGLSASTHTASFTLCAMTIMLPAYESSIPFKLHLQDGEELRAAINNKLPAKIDIGPVYNVDPKHRNAYAGTRPV